MNSYLGNEPSSGLNTRDHLAGDGVTKSFPLSRLPAQANGILAIISGVVQDALTYGCVGKTVVFSEAPPSPPPGVLQNIEIVFLGKSNAPYTANWKIPIADNVGTPDALAATFNPAITSLTDKLVVEVILPASNATTTPTFNLGTGDVPIVNYDGTALDIGQLTGSTKFRYDAALTKWVVIDSYKADTDRFKGYATLVRQAVSSSLVDANGYPVFMTTAASLNLPILAATAPLCLTAANGFNAYGQVNRPGIATTDATLALPNNSSLFIYADVAANGTLTYGHTTLAPVVQRIGVPSIAAGQFTFNWLQMKGYLGNGAAAVQAYRVFLGEAVTSGGVITSVINYALNRGFQSILTAIPAAGTATNFAPNIGFTSGVELRAEILNVIADGGYSVDDVLNVAVTQYSTGAYLIGTSPLSKSGRNNARFVLSNSGLQIPSIVGGTVGNATSIAGTPTCWRLIVSASCQW